VVLRADRQATEAELRAFCREHVAPYKVPSRVQFRTELPKTMVGKVLRRALRDEAGALPGEDGFSGRRGLAFTASEEIDVVQASGCGD
jgi:acyl-coenzyme A synthetase/AMP-(fatty) acid ligase